ncbi:MAG: hypothetical protein ABI284_08870 [Nitrosospira sp.]
MSQSLQALNALNFFIADVRDGLGPFLGVFLQGKDWSPSQIGIVMTLEGFVGMAARAVVYPELAICGLLTANEKARQHRTVV